MAIGNISGYLGSILTNGMKQSQLELLQAYERISTGRRINRASDDAAGLAIATRMESQQRAMFAAERNTQMAINMVRTAEGSLNSVTEDVQRIRELSVQAANGTLTDTDRAAIQTEVANLKENISYTMSSAQFNTKDLFAGNTETFQVGPTSADQMQVEFPAITLESLGIDDLDVSTQAGAEAAMTQASGALDQVTSQRATFGSFENRFESALNNLAEARMNTTRSLSSIRDANMAEEFINATAAQTRLEAQMMITSQIMGLEGSLVTRLLG